MFFDIHKHLHSNSSYERNCLYNIFPYLDKAAEYKQVPLFSPGLHPKDTASESVDSYAGKVKEAAEHKNCSAIGEIGLDRYFPCFDKQKEVFEELVKYSEDIGKPVIIHCVKSYSEILHYRKRYSEFPWILHGFRGKQELCRQLIDADIYVSFGSAILNPSGSLISTIKSAPLDYILFETDESDKNISSIYSAFSRIRGISLEDLKNQINNNLKQIL